MKKKTCLFYFLFFYPLFSSFSQNQPAQLIPWSNGKVVVSDNKHFLQFENDTPFFWLGETGWLLFQKLSREEATLYLENRKDKGFNVIQCMVIHSVPEVNCYGDSAFMSSYPAKPHVTVGNDFADAEQYDYWDHIEYVVDEAARCGLYIALVPVWGGVVKQGFFNPETAEQYARFLAERFKNRPNIFWINGGDMQGYVKREIWEAIGATLKEYDPNHLITYHPFGRTQSSTWFHNSAWLDFNMFQSGHRRYDQDDTKNNYGEDNWRYVLDDYAKSPAKPTLDGEPSYENIPQGLHDTTQSYWNENDIRRYAYWSVFAGACGHTYGNNAVMQMYRPEDRQPAYGARSYWNQAMNDSGAYQMKYIKQLMLSRPYFERINDQSLVIGDAGERYERILVTRGEDYLMTYTYTGRSFSLKMGRIAGEKLRAWWYNPRNGEATQIGILKNEGIISFDPPGDQSNGNDWVLVLDNASKCFIKPGVIIEK